ncbi:MAG: Lrp/AsnC family transcriptional regulator [Aliiglaciecola sp.]|uniref:Lrp/AsnC family transcriptional regulator n=1 Tax=Aliiglaciecola sp. TaxID=1872441 RepID=UPI003297FA3A
MLDNKDKQIVSQLEEDGRLSFSTLGDAIGLSKTPCWNRVKTLQEQQVITGFSAILSPQAMGLNIRALVNVVIDIGQHQAFEEAIINHASIRACHAITGEFDYVLEILAKDITDFDELLRVDLSKLPGVLRFNTAITTRLVKQNGHYSKML